MADADYRLALKLQYEFDQELQATEMKTKGLIEAEAIRKSKEKWRHREAITDLDSTLNLVHPEWETLDPTPDVHALFVAFDNKFFQDRLKCVTLEWSKRMYSCAGICYSRANRLGMAITIRLSEPLLKLRSRKDLVETLLHEMIHAYCSVLGIREGNGGHGPNFKKIMQGINKVAGTNITVYHNFHDEVDIYKTHWWRCNGLCQHRKPFLGYVKRTCNRAPGPNDIWWRNHSETCGGTFLKVREPGNKPPKAEKENESKVETTKDIRTFFGNQNKNATNPKGFVKSNGGATIVINKDVPRTSRTFTSSKPYKGSVNVVGFKDLNIEIRNVDIDIVNIHHNPGMHHSKNISESTKASSGTASSASQIDRDRIRNIWTSKFPANATKRTIEINENNPSADEAAQKRRKVDAEPVAKSDKIETDYSWTEIDEEVMFKEPKQVIIDISSDEENSVELSTKAAEAASNPATKLSADERQRQIKQEIIDSCDSTDDVIELIDDEFNDDAIEGNVELADTSLIDDLFGEDTLLRDFKKHNSVVASNSRYHADPKNDIISCPVCQDSVTRELFTEHLNGCIGISVKVAAPKVMPFYKRNDKKSATILAPDAVKRALKSAGYEENEIAHLIETDIDEPEGTPNRRRALDTSTHGCPVCGREVDVDRINEHLDECLPDQ